MKTPRYVTLIYIINFLIGFIVNLPSDIFMVSSFSFYSLYIENDYLVFVTTILSSSIILLVKDWRNVFFLIPIIVGHYFFAAGSSAYTIFHDYYLDALTLQDTIIFFLLTVLLLALAVSLYSKKLWAIWVNIIFGLLIIGASVFIVIKEFTDENIPVLWGLLIMLCIQAYLYFLTRIIHNPKLSS